MSVHLPAKFTEKRIGVSGSAVSSGMLKKHKYLMNNG